MNISHITCPVCNTSNRIPSDRLADGPKCGKCKNPLFQGMPVELTASNAASIIGNTELPVLVDCWAPWCGPCKGFAPVFEQAAREFEPRLRLAKLDTQAWPDLGGRWKIRSIPTLILFLEGKEAARISGAMSLAQLKQWLSEQGISI